MKNEGIDSFLKTHNIPYIPIKGDRGIYVLCFYQPTKTNWTKKEGCQCQLVLDLTYLTWYNGVICYPSFNNQTIEAWPQDRIEKFQFD